MKRSIGRVHLSTPSILTQRQWLLPDFHLGIIKSQGAAASVLQDGKRDTPLNQFPSRHLPCGMKFCNCRHKVPACLDEASFDSAPPTCQPAPGTFASR
jgi:hypothetical protein